MPGRTLIQVILPLRLEWEPCYWTDGALIPGDRVIVAFSNRQYVGVVHRLDVQTEVNPSKILPVIDADPGLPAITPRELALWEFIASYYLCTIGEVYYAAYPHNKTKSEKVAARAGQAADKRRELERNALSGRLERLRQRLAAKEESIRRRMDSARASAAVTSRLEEEREDLRRQIEVLEVHISNFGIDGAPLANPVFPFVCEKSPKPLLLQSSNRIGAYSEAIRPVLDGGRSVLVLAPDVLYCNSLAASLSHSFPDAEVVTSKETAVRRRRVSDSLRGVDAKLVIGTRSALFLPFRDLGLIIVDEEQDTFYKQEEPAPRYNGRDCAVKLAAIHGAAVILGSSCPSLESIHNARTGRYEVMAGSGPVISGAEVIDIAAERRKRGVAGIFTYKLVEAIRCSEGGVVLIRGWERQEDLQRQIAELFPGREITVLRWLEAREADFSDVVLVGILQADALVDKDDFRADERGAQIVAQLASRCRRLLVQTNVAARFDGSRTAEDLLDERRDFGFPPFTRLVDMKRRGTGMTVQRFFLPKNSTLAARKAEIAEELPKDAYLDVDPL